VREGAGDAEEETDACMRYAHLFVTEHKMPRKKRLGDLGRVVELRTAHPAVQRVGAAAHWGSHAHLNKLPEKGDRV
jgi:hypothetical protein